MDWSEFSAISIEQWEQRLKKELKNISPESLQKNTEEGIPIHFLYTQGVVESTLKKTGIWQIRQDFQSSELQAMREAQMNGVDVIFVRSDTRPQVNGKFLLQTNSLVPDCQTVWFPSEENMIQGKWNDLAVYADFYGVNAALYQEAGAYTVQTIAYAIKEISESPYHSYLVQLGVGSHYFLEIAKFRALRMIWQKKFPQKNLQLHAQTGKYNKTIQDVHNNLIRNTLEAMSAILGTADAVSVLPYDLRIQLPNDFSYRMARNIQLLLKEESYLDKVADPTSGAWLIESLTQSIVSEVDKMLLELEPYSFSELIKQNIIQDTLASQAAQRIAQVENKTITYVGVNKFVNPSSHDTALVETEIPHSTDFKTLKTIFSTNPS